jgi:uncharacterized FAD-dependent dehydrogenase
MRQTIEALGGAYRFQSKVTDLLMQDGRISGVTLEDGTQIQSRHVVLAVGHSARDVFEMLLARGVAIEAKPFSIGFRIEHPQSLIDKARFGGSQAALGAAEYRLVHVPRRHGGGGGVRTGPRCHQRHEPIFSQ